MDPKLLEDFEKLIKSDMVSGQRKPSLEEVFQKTLDITTPTTPGHLQSMRKHQDAPQEEWNEWIE